MKRKLSDTDIDILNHSSDKKVKINNSDKKVIDSDKMDHACQYCPRIFFTKEQRDSHLDTHGYLCEKCDMKLFSMADLRNHIKESHEQNGPKQTTTEPAVKIVSKLNESVQEVELNGKLTFKCGYCAAIFVNKTHRSH